jgi:co-chaperonin GroES (HSP10)
MISDNSKHELTSDEFLSPKDIAEQLDKLRKYIAAKREVQPLYRLPRPVGWRLTVLILTPPDKTSGGLELPGDIVEAHSYKAVQGVIIGMGADCYKDTDRFPGGPWVTLGDRIQFKRYDTSQFELANGQRLGTLTDSQPIGKVDNWDVADIAEV